MTAEHWLMNYASQPELKTEHLKEYTLFTDGSGSVKNGQWKAGCSADITEKVLLGETLHKNWAAQQAEFWAVMQVLNWHKNRKVNIYTDFQYTFTKVHAHGIQNK